jgi:ClpX C4-type zinc finger
MKPPIVLDGCRIEQFAVLDRSMTFEGHGLLFRGDKMVGPVPRLALGRDPDNTVRLLHCDARWNVVGSSGGYEDVRTAKGRAERFYRGLSKAWVRTGYTKAQANRQMDRISGPKKCSLCSRSAHDVQSLVDIKKRKFAICDVCVRELHELITSNDDVTD